VADEKNHVTERTFTLLVGNLHMLARKVFLDAGKHGCEKKTYFFCVVKLNMSYFLPHTDKSIVYVAT